MIRKLLLFLIIVSSLGADQRFEDEEEAVNHRWQYRLLDQGKWYDGEYHPSMTMVDRADMVTCGNFFYQWNTYRKSNGLGKVYNLRHLDFTAKISAELCAKYGMAHEHWDGWDIARYMFIQIGTVPTYVYENLLSMPAQNLDKLASQLLESWISSPPHNEMLLEPDIKFAGLGGKEAAGKRYYALIAIDDQFPPETLPPDVYATSGLE